MKTRRVAGTILLSFLAASPAGAQSGCLECNRAATDELNRCQTLAATAAERGPCNRIYADMARGCAAGVCAQEIETRTALRCADCRSTASAEAERCKAMTPGSDVQVACARTAGDLLGGCEVRFCRSR
jgi:hypothetical protein